MPSAPSARSRIRAELTREITDAARRRLAEDGASALSLRAVARDLGMVPSALYRYVPSRDALLTALIIDAYHALADVAEEADPLTGPEGRRWVLVSAAVRSWGLEHPHEWALVYGSPVPGYAAPEATIAAALRVVKALARPLLDAHRAGYLVPAAPVVAGAPAGEPAVALATALAPVGERVLPGVPDEVIAHAVAAWTQVIGAVSLELFGHYRNGVLDPAVLFAHTMRNLAAAQGLSGG